MGMVVYFYAESYGCGCSDMLAPNLSQVMTNRIIDHDYITRIFGYVIAIATCHDDKPCSHVAM